MTLKNFKRPKGEKVYYYSTTVENGSIVRHDGDKKHAVYESEIEEIQRRSNLWHNWVGKNIPDAYDAFGIMRDDVIFSNMEINRQFMDGEREE